MLFEINNKYYVKVGKDFVEVELVFKDNDVDLKATKNKLENNSSLKIREFNFLQEKKALLEKHKKTEYNLHEQDEMSDVSVKHSSSKSSRY